MSARSPSIGSPRSHSSSACSPGVRIAADALKAPVSKWLSPVLPQGEIWSWHFLAGLTLFFCASAYIVYVMRSGLAPRNSLKKTRVLRMPAPASMKWGAVNVALHWFVYALIAFLTGTGAVLYLGYGGWWVYLHSTAAFVGLGYIFAHVLAHYLQGGWWQVFRVFRPQRLHIDESGAAKAASHRAWRRCAVRGARRRPRLAHARHLGGRPCEQGASARGAS